MTILWNVTLFNLNYPNKTKNQRILFVNLQTNKIPTIVGQTNKRINDYEQRDFKKEHRAGN